MRVLFATVPIPATERSTDGVTAAGVVFFQVTAYSPTEPVRTGTFPAEPASAFLKDANSAGRAGIWPPPRHPEWPPVEIPVDVLRQVALGDGVVMEWIWRPTR